MVDEAQDGIDEIFIKRKLEIHLFYDFISWILV